MRKIYKILALFSLLVIIGYQVTTICLSHVHVVGQSLVVHYHPFAAGEKQTHTHTTGELSLIQNLFPTIVSIVALAFFVSVILILKRVIAAFCEKVSITTQIYIAHNRGPPSLRALQNCELLRCFRDEDSVTYLKYAPHIFTLRALHFINLSTLSEHAEIK